MGALKGLPKAQARRRAKELLELVGLSQAAKGKIKTYSGGMKQRLGIAQALLGHPKLACSGRAHSGAGPKGAGALSWADCIPGEAEHCPGVHPHCL